DRVVEEAPLGVRTVHAVLLRCERLRLTGKADVIEFHPSAGAGEVAHPVEYKRGRRRRWDNNEVQLCAQALCLEEMLGAAVAAWRAQTEEAARRLHELFASGVTPPPVLKPRCRGCSLHDLCMPELLSQASRPREYQRRLFVPAQEVG